MSVIKVEDPPVVPYKPEPASIDKTDISSKKKHPFKTVRSWVITFVLLGLLAALFASILAMLTPSWYRPPADSNADEVTSQADIAQALILDLHNMLSDPKITKPIVWTITQPQIDSLLATWVGDGSDKDESDPDAHHGIVISSPYVRFTDGAVTFALRVENLPGKGVVSLTISVHTIPSTDPNGPAMGQVQIESLDLGMLPLPSSILLAAIKSKAPELTGPVERVVAWYAGSQAAGNIGPQIVQDIQNVLNGKPFPMQLRMGSRTLTIERLEFHDSSVDAGGQEQPASMTMEFTPSSQEPTLWSQEASTR
ncbi:MAG TPA: hypothetical protein VMG59_00735 [Phycisphaerae bacterium]|nr:hypothetical protein [Phycisphaerae bacterium]